MVVVRIALHNYNHRVFLQDEYALENVQSDLDRILNNGVFKFKEEKDMSVSISLEYQIQTKKVVWSVQDIDGFEQKLGLIDSKNSDEEDIQLKIKHFLETSEVSFFVLIITRVHFCALCSVVGIYALHMIRSIHSFYVSELSGVR